MTQNFASCGSQPKKYFGESITPKNIIIHDNTIDVEYNSDHWCYKGEIVSLINPALIAGKNNDKINCRRFDDATNTLMLNYDDGTEKFSVPLNKKIISGSTNKFESTIKSFVVLLDEVKEKVKKINCKKTEENKIIDNHQKIIDAHKKIIDDHRNEFERKAAEEKKIIDDHQKIINEHCDKVNRLDCEMTESVDQIDFYSIMIKHDCGLKLNINDSIKLLSKEIITYEHLVANSTSCDIVELINAKSDQLKKLIIDKNFNINTKNKEGKTLLEISLKKYVDFPIFLLKNDIDISLSVKNDVKNFLFDIYCTGVVHTYFDNAIRNNHLDLLVTHYNDIAHPTLRLLIDEYKKSTPSLEDGTKNKLL
jgi:hypothetical protein